MSHLGVKEIKNPNGFRYNVLTVDGIPLGTWLDQHVTDHDEYIATGIKTFESLMPAWSMDLDWKGDRNFVRTLIDMDRAPLPILLCEEDPDFSCIVIVADVEKTEDYVYWNRIGYVLHDKEDFAEEKKKGIAYTEGYTAKDWERYGDNIALEPIDSDVWHDWIGRNWDIELYKRRMNYTLPYYLAQGNVRWFIDTEWAFDRSEYEQAVQQLYKQEKLCHTEYLLRTMKSNTDCKDCAKLLSELLPNGEAVFQEHMDKYGEILFEPYVCEVIAEPLKNLSKSINPDKVLLETYHNALKILKNFGDKQVQNALEISVLDDFDGIKALLVIDVQERYMHKYDPNLIPRINNRISEADNDGILTIYVKNAGDPGSEDQYALADNLLIVSEYIFEKKYPSAFTSEEFKIFLEKQEVTELELIGVDGSSCVAKTAFAAKENGYEVNVNLNCVSSVNDKIFKDTQVKMKEVGIRVLIKDGKN